MKKSFLRFSYHLILTCIAWIIVDTLIIDLTGFQFFFIEIVIAVFQFISKFMDRKLEESHNQNSKKIIESDVIDSPMQ